jgi:hypothetical protein
MLFFASVQIYIQNGIALSKCIWAIPWEFCLKGIHTQKPPQPRIINPHAIILLAAFAFYIIVILLPIKPIPVSPGAGIASPGHQHPKRIGAVDGESKVLFKELIEYLKLNIFQRFASLQLKLAYSEGMT